VLDIDLAQRLFDPVLSCQLLIVGRCEHEREPPSYPTIGNRSGVF